MRPNKIPRSELRLNLKRFSFLGGHALSQVPIRSTASCIYRRPRPRSIRRMKMSALQADRNRRPAWRPHCVVPPGMPLCERGKLSSQKRSHVGHKDKKLLHRPGGRIFSQIPLFGKPFEQDCDDFSSLARASHSPSRGAAVECRPRRRSGKASAPKMARLHCQAVDRPALAVPAAAIQPDAPAGSCRNIWRTS